MKPSDLDLPYKGWQAGQEGLVARIASSDKRYVVVEAPTGIGKSAVAMGVGYLLGEQTVVLTGTKQLQAQYAIQIPGVRVAMGRDNYTCDANQRVTAAKGECVFGQKCVLKNTWGCGYYGAILEAEKASRAALNYSYWLNQTSWARRFRDVDVLVCDEAHLLEDELRRFVSVNLSRAQFKRAGLVLPRSEQNWVRWGRRVLDRVRPYYQRMMQGEPMRSIEWAIAVKHVFRGVSTLVSLYDEDGWTVLKRPWGFEFKPVWVASCFKPYVDQWVKKSGKIVMLSATILNIEQFARQLGLDPGDIDFVQCDSPFPVKNRQLHYRPVGKVSFKNPQVVQAVIAEIDELLGQHTGERGLIHTSSYQLAREIFEGSVWQQRMMVHDTKGRTATLQRYVGTPGAVLVSPSMGTGVDLPYELLSFQIIAKLPFPDLSDPQIKHRMKIGPDGLPNPRGESWYMWQTACAVIQAYGRGVRAIDDACVTYLLDGNWRWFRQATKAMLPRWFTRAIVTHGGATSFTVQDILAQIRG